MKLTYAVVIERAPNSYSAYVPDLPACNSVADIMDEMRAMVREGIEFYAEFMQGKGETIDPPKRTLLEAMQYHIDLLNEPGFDAFMDHEDEDLDTETTFALIEVDVAFEPVAASAAPASVS